MNKKTFIEPSVEIVACESAVNILAGSSNTDTDKNAQGADGTGARNAAGSITPTTSSEAFGD